MHQDLLVYLSEDFTDADPAALAETVAALAETVERLSETRAWTVEAPAFVDGVDDESATRPEDLPIRTVGALLRVTLPTAVPGTPVDEVTAFLEALAAFSGDRSLEMEVLLGQTYVGTIQSGVLNETLRRGLLETWELPEA